MTPRLSILVPTYNRAGYLRECLASLLATTVDCEVVVSDNASDDETPAMLAGWDDDRLRIFRQAENLGSVPNHNFLLSQARGDYLCLFGDDDRALPGGFERQVALLDANPHVAMAYATIQTIDSAGRPRHVNRPIGWLPYPYVGGRDEFTPMLINNHLAWQTLVVRREVALAAAPLELVNGAVASVDWTWFLRMMRGREAAFSLEPTVEYRVHEGAVSRELERSGQFYKDRFKVWERFLLDAPDPPLVDNETWRRMGLAAQADAKSAYGDGLDVRVRCEQRLAALRRRYEARMAGLFPPRSGLS